MDGPVTLNFTDTPNIDIELEEGIGNNELNDLFGDDDGENSEIHQPPKLQIAQSCLNYEANCNDKQNALHDNSERTTKEHILSEYTGEISTVEFFATQTEEHFEEPIDEDNDVSPCPGTSSSQVTIPSSTTSVMMNRFLNWKKQQPSYKSSEDTHSVRQQQNSLSVPTTTITANAAVGQGQVRILERRFENDENNNPAIATTEEQFEDPIDMDRYVSPCPGTSSSQANNPTLYRNDSTFGRNLSASDSMNRYSNLKQQLPNKSNETRSLPQHRNCSSATKETIPAKATIGQGKVRVPTVPSNRKAIPTAPAAHETASSRADATTSDATKEKRIEAIRQRMESCLTAITNKVTEKEHRSPYAPFLAYLGTKLPNVSMEILPRLEKQILDLVDRHSE